MTPLHRHLVPALPGLLCVAVIMTVYHDQFWWPVDEGVYAYVAQRANAGDVIHRDLIDLHGGYGNILNAWAFRLFGEDLLSLRYPLVALTVLQCAVALILLRTLGPTVAFAGVVTIAAFSFVQFPNPSANWHALFFFFGLSLLLQDEKKDTASRLLLAGAFVGFCFFTRQLSGVFLALGLICVLLAEAPRQTNGPRAPGVMIGLASFTGLLLYLASKQDWFGLVWGGLAPLAMLLTVTLRARFGWAYAGRTAGLVAAGFILSGLPLALRALSEGAFSYWVSDIFLTALLINGQDFISQASYMGLLHASALSILSGAGAIPVLSGVAWILLVLSVPVLGIYATVRLHRSGSVEPAVLLAVFWAVGALHYQIPIYLLFVLQAVLFGCLVACPNRTVTATLLALSTWALVFQAGQPLERGLTGIVSGQRSEKNVPADLPRISLRIQPHDAAIFREVIEFIEATAAPKEPLMTIPMEPELNFAMARKSPVPYYGTPLGLRLERDVEATLDALDAAAPLFVVNRRNDKYLTPLSASLLARVRERSDAPVRIGPFDLYRYLPIQMEVKSSPSR